MALVLWFASVLLLLQLGYTIQAGLLRQRPRLDGRIVGGKPVDISQIPFQVSLQRNYHFCGGSLIGPRTVLTAAHCTEGSPAGTFKVRIGSTQTAGGGVLVDVQKVHRHELYNAANIDYDFSILELAAYNERSVNSSIVMLPTSRCDDVPDGTPLVVSGWGNTQNNSESRDTLRAVSVPKANQEQCSKSYAAYGGVTARMLCAGLPQGGKDACQGDSGGPLVHEDTLVGVVSWGFGCAKPDYPGVYARVAAVRDWIKTVSGI